MDSFWNYLQEHKRHVQCNLLQLWQTQSMALDSQASYLYERQTTQNFLFFPRKESEESKITYSDLRWVAGSRKAYSRVTTQYFYIKGTDNPFMWYPFSLAQWKASWSECLITDGNIENVKQKCFYLQQLFLHARVHCKCVPWLDMLH